MYLKPPDLVKALFLGGNLAFGMEKVGDFVPQNVLFFFGRNGLGGSSPFMPRLLIHESKQHLMGESQGTIGSTPNSVPMVFIVFSRDSWG